VLSFGNVVVADIVASVVVRIVFLLLPSVSQFFENPTIFESR